MLGGTLSVLRGWLRCGTLWNAHEIVAYKHECSYAFMLIYPIIIYHEISSKRDKPLNTLTLKINKEGYNEMYNGLNALWNGGI